MGTSVPGDFLWKFLPGIQFGKVSEPPSLPRRVSLKLPGACLWKLFLAAFPGHSASRCFLYHHSSLLICAHFQQLWVGSPIKARNKKFPEPAWSPAPLLPASMYVCACVFRFWLWAPTILCVCPSQHLHYSSLALVSSLLFSSFTCLLFPTL